jgi:branched-chain amino acid transport system permease protein
MISLLQTLLNGIVIGGTYALMAVGLTLIFGFMKLVNFAHGELYMLGAYFAYTFMVSLGLPFVIGLPLAIIGGILLGYLLDVILFRPLRQRDPAPFSMMSMLTTIGLVILFQNLALLIWNPVPKRIPVPLQLGTLRIGNLGFRPAQVIVAVVAVALIVGAHQFMQRSKIGMGMRATFQDPDVAALMGVNVERMYSLTFAFGAGLAAAGGALLGMVFLITPTMGQLASLKAFTVVILGGLGSFMGAIAGAMIVGSAESLTATYGSSGYAEAVAFVLLLGILVLRPQGLLGRKSGVE